MSRALEDSLANLHGVVAKVLTEQVQHQSQEVSFDEQGLEIHGDTIYDCSPATIATCRKLN